MDLSPKSLVEVREAIDRLDREIVGLLAQRSKYVAEAARFKRSAGEVADPHRVQTMLQDRRAWAREEGISPDLVEKLYRGMVEHFTQEETEHWMHAQKNQQEATDAHRL